MARAANIELELTSDAGDGTLVAEARQWILDCEWADVDGDSVAELSAREVLRGVARHYEGGLAQFVQDAS